MQLVKQEVLLRPARRAALFSLLVSLGVAGSMLAGRIRSRTRRRSAPGRRAPRKPRFPPARSASALSSSAAWLMPRDRGAEDHRRGQDPGDLGGVVEGAAGHRPDRCPPASAAGRAGGGDEPGSNGIGSIRQIGSSASSQPRPPAASRDAARRLAEHRRELVGVGVAKVDDQLGDAGDRGRDARLEPQLTRSSPTPPCSTAIRSIASAASAAASAGVAADVHRRRAGVRCLAADREAVALDPDAARRPRPSRCPRASSTGPCSM